MSDRILVFLLPPLPKGIPLCCVHVGCTGRRLSGQARVQDIEQLVETGRAMGACPYYSARKAIAAAEV